MKLLRMIFSSLLLVAGLTCAAYAQRADLSGTVTDQNGAAVSGAKVTVTKTDQGLKREVTTNEQGYFSVPLLQPGTYTVTAQAQGFNPSEITNVVLNVEDSRSIQIKLNVGGVGETVTVNASSGVIKQDAAVDTVVDRQFIANMPLNGRSLQSLIALTPGVVFQKVDTNPLAGGQFSVNGQRPNANYFTVDGVSANVSITTGSGSFSGESASGALPGLNALGGTNSLVSIDALQEFKIQTSTYAPEFGRMPGGQISLSTRSGTNSFHGDVFDYLRNSVLDANTWFANQNNLPKAQERQNDFGGVFGGPVVKDRLFFFFSYEGLRLRQPVTAIQAVPSIAAREQAPASVRPFLDAFPIPNGAVVAEGLQNFAANYSNPATDNTYSIRMDGVVRKNVTIFGTFKHAPSESDNRGGSEAQASLSQVEHEIFANDAVTVGTTWLVSSTVTNDLRFNWSRVHSVDTRTLDNFGGAVPVPNSLLFPSGFTPGNYQFIWIAYNPSFQSTPDMVAGTGNDNFESQINVVDNVSWVKGSHSFKFGIDYRRITPTLNKSGGNFDAALFLLNTSPNVYIYQSARGGGANDVLFQNISSFAQDTWKINRKLTLTYGLRWDINPPPTSMNGHDPAVLLNLGGTGPATFAPQGTKLWETQYTAFAPRLGFSYQISQKSGWETVLRGGAGMFYDTGAGVLATAFDHIYPYFASAEYFGIPFPVDTSKYPPPKLGVDPPQQFYLPVRNLRLPYTVQWNGSLEQSLGRNQSLTISYIGSSGRNLLFVTSGETTVQGFGSTLIPYAYTTNQGYSNYHSLQIQFQRRLSHGIQALASYSLSRSYDTSSGDDVSGVPPQFLDVSKQYAPSDYDVRHTITGALTVDFPTLERGRFAEAITRGWGTDILERFRTALPTNLVTFTSIGVVNFSDEPNVNPNVPLILHGSQYPGGKIINTAALSTPTPGTLGNFPRNSLRFFNASQTDVAVRRTFGLTERFKLQFRMEFFNIFNHPNFADPTGTMYLPNYNISTQTLAAGLGGLNPLYQVGGPRSGQVSLKLLF